MTMPNKPRKIPQPYWEFMLGVYQLGGLHVTAENLLQAAWVVENGFGRAEDDYEGPRVYLSESIFRKIEAWNQKS